VTDNAAGARFEEMFERHAAAVLRFARRRILDDEAAWDVVSETFLTAWRHVARCPMAAEEQLPWLYAIAGNAVRTHRRGQRRRDALTRRVEARTPAVSVDPADEIVSIDAIATAMSALSEIDQEVLRLIAWEQLPDATALGAALGIGPAAAAVRVHRARRRLSRRLSAADVDEVRERRHDLRSVAGSACGVSADAGKTTADHLPGGRR